MPATQKSQIPNPKSPISFKPRRLEEIATSKAGLFAIDPTLLTVEPGFNERIHWGDLQALADDIAANGLDQPLKIRKVEGSETIYIVSGHRRHRAITTLLIPNGRWKDLENPKANRPVNCFAEARHTTPLDRLFSQIAGNTGLPYTLLEKARVYRQILTTDTTIKPADLARRSGETKQAVSDALCLVNQGCTVLISNVQDGTLSASTAIQIIKQAKDHSQQESIFIAALEKAHLAGSPHVTPKHLPSESGLGVPPQTVAGASRPDSSSESSNSQHLFTLYHITGTPEESTTPDGPFYHETERLCLESPPAGIDLLHLLSAITDHGTAYGYRVNDSTYLPDMGNLETLDQSPEIGYAKTDRKSVV